MAESHRSTMVYRLRVWGYGSFLPVFGAGIPNTALINTVVPCYERMVEDFTANRQQCVFRCSIGRKHTVGCITLRTLFPENWITSSFVFSRNYVVMAGLIEGHPLFVVSESSVGELTDPESYELTLMSLCDEPLWMSKLLYQLADDHRDDDDSGCWRTLVETYEGISQVLKSPTVVSHDLSMVFTMVNISSHDCEYWTSLLHIFDEGVHLLDPAQSPSFALVSSLQAIYRSGDFPISSDMTPYFWVIPNDPLLFYVGYNADDDCFVIGKCAYNGEVM